MPRKEYYQKYKEYSKQYRQSGKGKIAQEKYHQSDKGKLVYKKAQKKYWKSNKGKHLKHKHKAKRKRNLGFVPMFDNPFDELELINWHHITDVYVIALPKDLHLLYYGINHREKTMEIVKQIYLEGV